MRGLLGLWGGGGEAGVFFGGGLGAVRARYLDTIAPPFQIYITALALYYKGILKIY